MDAQPPDDRLDRANVVLVALFLIVLALPLAANLAGVDGADAAAEKRTLAPAPRLDRSLTSITTFGTRLSSWFNDHFGFRSTLVRIDDQTQLYGFSTSPTPTVIKGNDGWFFYADDGAVEDYTRSAPLAPEAVAGWRDTLVRTDRWLRSRAVAYLFTIAPDKHEVYPEEMPPSLRPTGSVSRTDQVLAALATTDVAHVDLRPALAEAKRRERIYEKTDSHWNDRGAFVAYQQIIDAVRRQLPAVPPAWTRDDFDAVERTVPGLDLAEMMGLNRVLTEEELTLVPRRRRLARVIAPAGASPTAEAGYLVTEIPGSTLPRAVVLRDSFTSRLVPFLSEHFSRVVYLWQNDFYPSVLEGEHPDVVIQEIVGRHLFNFVPSPELVPEQ